MLNAKKGQLRSGLISVLWIFKFEENALLALVIATSRRITSIIVYLS